MAVYHLSVKVVQRSAGRSATAAAAFRAACAIRCEREGKVHNYTRKQGVAEAFIVAPQEAPAWARDHVALWNAAEVREMRKDSVTAREWELGLPTELDMGERRQLAHDFAQALVDRYDVAALRLNVAAAHQAVKVVQRHVAVPQGALAIARMHERGTPRAQGPAWTRSGLQRLSWRGPALVPSNNDLS